MMLDRSESRLTVATSRRSPGCSREGSLPGREGHAHPSGSEIDAGISLGHIESGFQAGRDCYLPTKALEKAQNPYRSPIRSCPTDLISLYQQRVVNSVAAKSEFP